MYINNLPVNLRRGVEKSSGESVVKNRSIHLISHYLK